MERKPGHRCSVGMLKDTENGTYYPGCIKCEKPLKVFKTGEVNLTIKEKGSPVS